MSNAPINRTFEIKQSISSFENNNMTKNNYIIPETFNISEVSKDIQDKGNGLYSYNNVDIITYKDKKMKF